jgi:hypothetical protein
VDPRRRVNAVLKDVNRSEMKVDKLKLWPFVLVSFDDSQFI